MISFFWAFAILPLFISCAYSAGFDDLCGPNAYSISQCNSASSDNWWGYGLTNTSVCIEYWCCCPAYCRDVKGYNHSYPMLARCPTGMAFDVLPEINNCVGQAHPSIADRPGCGISPDYVDNSDADAGDLELDESGGMDDGGDETGTGTGDDYNDGNSGDNNSDITNGAVTDQNGNLVTPATQATSPTSTAATTQSTTPSTTPTTVLPTTPAPSTIDPSVNTGLRAINLPPRTVSTATTISSTTTVPSTTTTPTTTPPTTTVPTTTPTTTIPTTTTPTTPSTTTSTTTVLTTPTTTVSTAATTKGRYLPPPVWLDNQCYDRCDATFCGTRQDAYYEVSPCAKNYCKCTGGVGTYLSCPSGKMFDALGLTCKVGNAMWCPDKAVVTSTGAAGAVPPVLAARCSRENCLARRGISTYFPLDCCSPFWCYCYDSASPPSQTVQTCAAGQYFDHRSEWMQCRDKSLLQFCP
ncbi:hypothetical protein RvY_13539 [Ramazzottius varieornatus]|uniref:Chitin-binding type-2 domain-containing protein n=1 Tax=Ramazzottius varieornatus TaxID=947166 RepID=A0A1D1VN86_RAMVA|nr:hypothetical protein RvY_13539 [Ramazzottius varieornatus]